MCLKTIVSISFYLLLLLKKREKFLNLKFFRAKMKTHATSLVRGTSEVENGGRRKFRGISKIGLEAFFSGNTDRYISLRDILIFHYNLTCKVSFLFKGGGPSHLSLLRKRKSWHKKSHIGFFFVLVHFFFFREHRNQKMKRIASSSRR